MTLSNLTLLDTVAVGFWVSDRYSGPTLLVGAIDGEAVAPWVLDDMAGAGVMSEASSIGRGGLWPMR